MLRRLARRLDIGRMDAGRDVPDSQFPERRCLPAPGPLAQHIEEVRRN
jgi:hypothetical protein